MNRFQMNRDVGPGFALGCRIQRAVGRKHQAVDKWRSPSCELRVMQRIPSTNHPYSNRYKFR